MTIGYTEELLYFNAGDETLFGIVTEGAERPADIGVLAVCGGGWIPSPHRGAMYTRMARQFAPEGYRTMRFDYHGVGESTGTVRFEINRPLTRDAGAAFRRLGDYRSKANVLVGTCFGARTATALAAADADPNGVAILAVPIKFARTDTDVVREAFSWRIIKNLSKPEHRRNYARIAKRRISSRLGLGRGTSGTTRTEFFDDLERVLGKGIPVLFVYGEADREYEWFKEAQDGRLGRLIRQHEDLVDIVVVDGTFHGFHSAAAQRNVIETVHAWLETRIRPSVS